MNEGEKIVTAYIALGANLGDRVASIAAAIDWLRDTPGINVTRISSLLENPAVGGPANSPPFLNAAAEIQTSRSARELLDILLDAEIHLGRKRHGKWAPRVIDLDLLLYGDSIIDEPELQIPHPLMHQRKFVLKPLSEIAPNLRHPVSRLTITELLQRLPS